MNDAPSVSLEREPPERALPERALPERELPAVSASPVRGRALALAATLTGLLLALLAMAARPGLPGGLWLGALGIVLGSGGALALTHRGPAPTVAESVPGSMLLGPGLQALAALLTFWLALRLAVQGVVPAQTAVLALVVPGAFLWLVLSLAVAAGRLGWLPEPERPLWRRHGLWLIVAITVLYLPRLGSFGLIDCWETHYGEVAREVLSRDDWISLWWAQDGWFYSKPVLNFWAQALSFSALGVAWAPDEMIRSVELGLTPQPEWAARLPIFLLTVLGQWFSYAGARRYVGRWAAFLGSLVLASTPYWYLLARQSMADMAYVAPLAAAMGCLLLALHSEPEARVRSVFVPIGRFRIELSGYQLLFGALLLLALPQVLYLASRNVSLQWAELPVGFRVHLDQVLAGSPGNCELPGQPPCRVDGIGSNAGLQPLVAGLVWASACAALLWLKRGERRARRLYFLAAWLFTGLSFMGKGAPGLVLVLFTLGGYLTVRGRWREVSELELPGFGLLMLALVAPWFAQEFLRHGREFFERLFVHDMYLRAFEGVHDTNKGDDTSFRYYVWQLGYGLFPWSGLCAAGVLHCVARTFGGHSEQRGVTEGGDTERGVTELSYFSLLWLLGGFGMFAITDTKYHHYALPLVPPAALLTGVLLARFFGKLAPEGSAALAPAGTTLAAGTTLSGPSALQQKAAPTDGAWAIGAAAVVLLCGRDLAVTRPGDVEGAARLIQLITYNYGRSWPKTLDYSLPLWLFTAAAAACTLALLLRPLRRWAALGTCAVGLACCAWVIDGYLVEISPHWGQRETIAEYYKQRTNPAEPLVAYQLNWKGENFYTGNNVAIFVSSGKRFSDWVKAQKENGVQVMFFTTEHSRIGSLKRELGATQNFELLTDPSLNDKFVLARAVL